jgi:drug/metabolite transporter (DMT)-like permease
MALILALTAAASWGLADFLAGLASRRIAVPLVLLLVEGGGLVVIAVITLAAGEPFFTDTRDVAYALLGGLSGVVGLGCFYRALAIGTMSVVAPISAAGVTLPVIVGVASGNRPSAVSAVGLAVIVAGVMMVSREEHDTAQEAAAGRTAVLLALLSAVGLGGFVTLTDSPADASVLWTLVLSRSAALPFVAGVILMRRPALPSGRLALGVAAVGTIDLLATSLIAIANTKGDLSIVAVLGGMYPVVTVLLAAAVLRERLRPPQLAGVVLALGGIAAVAAG